MTSSKPVHTIILDAGPIIKNEPSVSTLLARCEHIITVPSVISEIKDANARSRVETTLLPFLNLQVPDDKSIQFVTDFASKTGDLTALSKTDVSILALAYEVECERNGGDWRLRRSPGQKTINGPVPQKTALPSESERNDIEAQIYQAEIRARSQETHLGHDPAASDVGEAQVSSTPALPSTSCSADTLTMKMSSLGTTGTRAPSQLEPNEDAGSAAVADTPEDQSGSSGSDTEGWITPSNLRKHQARHANAGTAPLGEIKTMQVATITTDYAMQNVLLQMGLNLISPSIQQVRRIRTYILRCHACFEKTKDMTKKFCPRCGKPTLTRVSCSTNAKGEFQIHLKRNMQWNHRGDRFSIPKPTSGTASGKVGIGKGGGKGGWCQHLILAEDQKEYLRAVQGEGRRKEKDLMDETYLPSILTGDRSKGRGRPKIGAGRNVNSRKHR